MNYHNEKNLKGTRSMHFEIKIDHRYICFMNHHHSGMRYHFLQKSYMKCLSAFVAWRFVPSLIILKTLNLVFVTLVVAVFTACWTVVLMLLEYCVVLVFRLFEMGLCIMVRKFSLVGIPWRWFYTELLQQWSYHSALFLFRLAPSWLLRGDL